MAGPDPSPSRVAVVGVGPLATHLADGLRRQGTQLTTLDDSGPLDAAVFVPWDPSAMTPRPFVELTDAEFGAAWQDTLDDAVTMCIQARERFGSSGGRLVLTIPTIAMAGGAQYAHWAAAAEGVHLLAKSATRQWGPDGITANVLAVGPAELLADPDAAGPVSIASPALPDADPGEVLAFLCSPAAAHLGGQTLVVDGGLWM